MIEIREVRNDTWTTETDPITTRNEPNGAIENMRVTIACRHTNTRSSQGRASGQGSHKIQ